MTGRRRWWGEYRTTELSGLDPERVVVVLPVAAIEQHGPHLPLSTDSDIMRGMLATALTLLPDDADIRILPVQDVGKSDEHVRFPGTLTMDATTALAAWRQIGRSVARAGVRKLVVLTSHGGNEEVMGILARDLRVEHDMAVVRSSWQRFGHPDGLFSPAELRLGIHGGDIETSLMLHFRPDLVAIDEARDFASRTSDLDGRLDLVRPQGTHAYAWLAGDLNPAGVVGNAAASTSEKGRATAEHQAAGFARLCSEFAVTPLSDLLA